MSDLPTVDYPTISRQREPARREPRDDGRHGRDAARESRSPRSPASTTSRRAAGSGRTHITLQFSLDRDVDAAAQDVNAAISARRSPAPAVDILPPSYRKQNPSAAPILFIALTSNMLPLSDLDEYAETTIAQRLSMVEGVAQVIGVRLGRSTRCASQLDPGAAHGAQHRA